MILSARERRILAEIERRLADTDPRFVKAMCRDTSGATVWTRRGCTAVTVLAGLTALLCAALLLIGPALVAALLATATHYLGKHRPPGTQCASNRNRQACTAGRRWDVQRRSEPPGTPSEGRTP
jgi:hypothetical protein